MKLGRAELDRIPFHMIQNELEGWAGQLVGPGCRGTRMEGGCYRYTTSLLGVDKCTPLSYVPTPKPLSSMVTPLKLREWESALVSHPDREYAHYLIQGIQRVLELPLIARVLSCNQSEQ